MRWDPTSSVWTSQRRRAAPIRIATPFTWATTPVFSHAMLTPNVNPGGSVTYSVTASGSGTIIGYSYDFGDDRHFGQRKCIGNAYLRREWHRYCRVDVIFSDSCIAPKLPTVTTTGALGAAKPASSGILIPAATTASSTLPPATT